MKNILIIGLSPIIGGVETYIYNLVKGLNKEKYTFDFLIIDANTSVFEDEINSLFNDNKNHFFFSPNLKKKPIKARKWLKDFYDSHHYDAIYMNTCTAARIKYCEYPIKKYGTKLISHSHQGNAFSTIHHITNSLYKRKITNLSYKKLACSELAYHWLFNDTCIPENIIVNGVDTNRFKFDIHWRNKIRNELGIDEDTIIIGNVGRFSNQKNQPYFIELIQALDESYKVLLIGDGDQKDKFLRKIESENLKNRFIVLDSKPDIEKYYSAMDVFAMPSVFEGLPIAAVEAQAEGLPCVFSDNISRQTALSENCQFINLKNLTLWKDTIVKYKKVRYDGTKTILENGFDNNRPVKQITRIFDDL